MSKRKFSESTRFDIPLSYLDLRETKRRNITYLQTSKRSKRMPYKAKRRNGKRGKSISAQINRAIDKRLETKFQCTQISNDDIGTTAFLVELSNIGQGVTQGARIGEEISPTYLEVRCAMSSDNTNVSSNFVRLMVVQSREGVLAVGDMPSTFDECPDWDNYNIFVDELLSLHANNGADDIVQLAWNYSKVLKRTPGVIQKIKYDAAGAPSLAGGIYFFAMASTITTNIEAGYVVLKYKDG